jgi:hypothetical protein
MLWLGLLLLVLALVALSPLAGQELWRKFMVGEKGLIENGTVVLLAPALVLCVLVFRRRRQLPKRSAGEQAN